jgi:hypothetical protein
MSFDALRSPTHFLQPTGIRADQDWLREYETWFEHEGKESQTLSTTPAHRGCACLIS